MNDNEIYELLAESFDDKVKLDFEDVKSRIAKLPDNKSAVITPAAPFRQNKTVFAVAIAAAACLVCVFGISVALSGGSILNKSESADSYVTYEAVSAEDENEIMYYSEESAAESSVNEAAEFGVVDDFDGIAYNDVSVSDTSATDLVSGSDVQ